jgi:hypothetical protein
VKAASSIETSAAISKKIRCNEAMAISKIGMAKWRHGARGGKLA